MKTLTFFIVTICMFSFYSCNNSDSMKNVNQKTIDEVTELLTQYSINWGNAISDKDPSEISDYFAPGFMYQNASGERVYRDEFIKGFIENPYTIKSFEVTDVEVKLYSPKIANVTGKGIETQIDKDGKEQILESRFTNVWQKNGGKWQCIIGHGNPVLYGDIKPDSEIAAELVQIWNDYIAASNSGDIEKTLTFFTEDYINMPSYNSTQTGKEEIRHFMQSFIENNKPHVNWYRQSEAFIHGNMAYAFGTFEMTNNPPGEKSATSHQRCITVYKKGKDGKWRFFRWMGQN